MPFRTLDNIRKNVGRWWPLGRKRSRFERLTDQFIRRLKRWPRPPSGVMGSRAKIGVLVLPWLETAVPFFSMECALNLAKDADVTLIWDPCNIRFNTARGHETQSLTRCLTQMKKWLPVINPADFRGIGSIDREFLQTVVYENAVGRTLGEQKAVELSERHTASLDEMAQHAGRIRTLLQTHRFDWIFVPGGVWGVSSIYDHIAAELGISFTTFDSGEGIIFISHDGAAAHYADMPPAFQEVIHRAKNDEARREKMRAAAHAVIETRKQGTDQYRLQPKLAGEAMTESWDILLPLNYRSDSAAMCRQRLFASVKDWLEKVLEWARNQPEVTIAIRQHPCEKIEEFRGSDRWQEMIDSFGLGNRCRFIAAEDPINTYDLLPRTRVVLPCTSRVGIEAAIFEKPVILGWDSYYEDCGFAWNARSIDEYFDLISQALRGELVVSPKAKELAEITYYVAEKCFGVETVFTPVPVDFKKWVEIPPDELWSKPETKLLRETLLTRQPMAVLRDRALMAPNH